METLSANALTYQHLGRAVTLYSRDGKVRVDGVIEQLVLLPNVIGVEVARHGGGSDMYLLAPTDNIMVKASTVDGAPR